MLLDCGNRQDDDLLLGDRLIDLRPGQLVVAIFAPHIPGIDHVHFRPSSHIRALYRSRRRGSRMSRKPSPRKLKPSTRMAIANPGKIAIQGEISM